MKKIGLLGCDAVATYGHLPAIVNTAPNQKVSVSLGAQTVSGKADETGKWMLRLAPLAAGGPHEVTISTFTGGWPAGVDSVPHRSV